MGVCLAEQHGERPISVERIRLGGLDRLGNSPTHHIHQERSMEERVLEVFDDLGIVNGARVSVRLVHRREQLILDIRKVRGTAFMPQGIELPPALVRRLFTQLSAIIAKLPPDGETFAPTPKASQPSPAKRRRERGTRRPS